ncbi:MAG: hypothetical protein JSV05_02045 [Candidatus Bathyarchaeota archaeon]|nr:MAG: hypothetical protein JSV05_02045 [Candidatus Bathyarchaeota archaeon]
MIVNSIEFTELKKEISETGKSHLDHLAPDIGKAYVIAISRDGCPACEKQKPEFNELAKTVAEKDDNKVIFARIHVRQPSGSTEESLQSKELLGHYFYPTNIILLRTADRGVIELYKSVSPEMTVLKRNIDRAIDIAVMIEKQTQKA